MAGLYSGAERCCLCLAYKHDLAPQDLISRLLERKPTRRLGMLNGRAADIKRHKWFDGLDWDALEARKMEPPRLPKDDSAKRLRELTVSPPSQIGRLRGLPTHTW